jgi:hypothetical protein
MAFSISDILMQQGKDAAEARRQRGQMWGGLLQKAGSLPGDLRAQQMAEQAAQQQAEIRQQQLEEGRRAQSAAIDAQDKQQIAAHIYASSWDPVAGKLDPAKVNDAIRRSGRPDMRPVFTDIIQKGLDADFKRHLDQLDLDTKQQQLENLRNPKPKLGEHDPTKPLINLETGATVRPATEIKPETRSLQLQADAAKAAGDMDRYNDILKTIHDTADSSHIVNIDTKGPRVEMTPESLDIAAADYRLNGKLPNRFDENDRKRIMNEAGAQAKLLGQGGAAVIQRQFGEKADAASLKKVTTARDFATAFENKALAQIPMIEELSKRVPRTQFPFINKALVEGQAEILGSSDAKQLYNAISTFTNEYAKIIEGATGSAAGSSEGARKASNRLVEAAMSKGTMTDVLRLMQREMRATNAGFDAVIANITERMGGAPAPAATPAPAAAPPPPLTPGLRWLEGR